MKSLQKIAVGVGCAALIFGAAITWHFVAPRLAQHKLAEDARACRVRAELGDAKAQSDLGHDYFHGNGVPQDYATALVWYGKAADQGEAKAQYALGYMHDHGLGVPQDYSEALRWYLKAGDQGDANAQYVLGNRYYYGKDLPQDYATALVWYGKAADQGEAKAQYALGYMYSQGQGVPQDYHQTIGWYRKAADQGYARAQSSLGYMYSHGQGVPQDYAEAARWYRKAAKQGDEYARHALDSMKIGFTTLAKISLLVVCLGSISLLVRSRGRMRDQQQRRTALTGLFGVLWVVAEMYGNSHFGILLSLSAVNAFYFGKGLLSGICGAMVLSIAWPQTLKIWLTTCGILFIGSNIYAATHYDLRSLARYSRVFYSSNGLLIGLATVLAIFLLRDREKAGEGQNGKDVVTSSPADESTGETLGL